MKWIKVANCLPTEADCIDGRVATLDHEGVLRYAMLIGEGTSRWVMTDGPDPVYWLQGIPPAPLKD